MRNDVTKRQVIAAGASAGVAAAFGAPIGGALFSYEMSKPNTFWTFSMLWRVFAASALSTFTLSFLTSMWGGIPPSLQDSSALKFGKLGDFESSMVDLPSAIFIGLICGVLGSFFIYVNVNMAIWRKKNINSTAKKTSEALFFACLTAIVFFSAVIIRDTHCFNY